MKHLVIHTNKKVFKCISSGKAFPLKENLLTLFRMDFLEAAHGRLGGKTDTKIGYTCPTMVKLATVISHLKKIQKIYESRDVPLQFCCHQHFFTRN